MNTSIKTNQTTNLIEITEEGEIAMKYGYETTLYALTRLLESNPVLKATITTLTTLSISQLDERGRASMLRTIEENSERMSELLRKQETPAAIKDNRITVIIENTAPHEKDTIC